MSEHSSNALLPHAAWQREVLSYATAINAYVAKGLAEGWDACGEEPQMAPSATLLPAWRAALIAANAPDATASQRAEFHENWPPAHAPLIGLLSDEGIGISALAWLGEQGMLARVGAPYEGGYVLHIVGDHAERVPDVNFFGQCPARRYLALADALEVVVTDGWQGPEVARLAWPTGLEDVPAGAEPERFVAPPSPIQLIPFPDGTRVLLVSAEGMFVLADSGARRIYPLCGSMDADEYPVNLDMPHGAISPDGRWVAVGSQSDRHLVFDASLNPVARIGPASEYPHFALFSNDSKTAILNACHFYNGTTLGVAVADLPGLDTECYSDDPRTPILQEGARVYAAVHRDNEFIIGDASGYVRAFDENGNERWQQYVGSTVSAMAVSNAGDTLIVATYAGFICTFSLDNQCAAPWQIGTGPHREVQRWIIWKSLEKPMLW